MSKVIKQMEMDDLKKTFAHVRDLAVLSAERLTAQGEHTFRSNMRKKGVRLRVVKNSLCRRVFRDLNLQVPDDSPYWQKPTLLAWGLGSISELLKEIDGELNNPKTQGLYKDKDKQKISRKGAIADGAAVTWETGAAMPTRAELLAQIVGMIIGPGAQLAACLQGPGSQVASQIEKISERKEGAEGPAPTAG
jgi:ribosomal protein L10